MRLVSFLTLLCAVPTMAFGAARDTDAVRIRLNFLNFLYQGF